MSCSGGSCGCSGPLGQGSSRLGAYSDVEAPMSHSSGGLVRPLGLKGPLEVHAMRASNLVGPMGEGSSRSALAQGAALGAETGEAGVEP